MNFHKDGTLPLKEEVFVFGSNLKGIHGKGAAKVAAILFGAKHGFFSGRCGNSYAIPTKDENIQTISLDRIKPYIDEFIRRSHKYQEVEYFVTRVGCGLAGYEDKDIAPLFKGCGDNVSFPEEWKEYIE
jgi:hypothetical protein